MNKNSFSLRLFSLLLAVLTVVGLCACPAGEPVPGTSGSTSASTTGSGTGSNPEDVTDAVYGEGADIAGTGASFAEGALALTPRTPDEANAEEIKNIASVFRSGSLTGGKTYRVTEASEITASDRTYDGGGAVFLAPQGLVINGSENLVLENMTVVGAVTVKNATNISFRGVEFVHAEGIALSVDGESESVVLTDCRLTGKTAAENAANRFAVADSYVSFTEFGIADTAESGCAYVNCLFEGKGTALTSSASELQIRRNSFALTGDAVGILLEGESLNTLVAQNSIKGVQHSLKIVGTTNTSVVLNAAVTVLAENNTSLYICDNSLGGRLRVKNNNYFLADGNSFPDDGLDHTALQVGNQNTNGDSLMDVDARLEVGADENLLPHTNKDLFHGMTRKSTVTDGCTDTGKTAFDYILEQAANGETVILAPGAYTVNRTANYTSAHSNTTVYGYGVYIEGARVQNSSLFALINVNGADKISFKGLTLGHERQSCGQVYVLDKMDANRILVVTGAGMDDEFGNTDIALYNVTAMGAQREGTFYAYCDTYFHSITKKKGGLMEMQLEPAVYEMIAEGDILTCRSVSGGTSVSVSSSTDILFKDITLYGNSSGLACYETQNRTAVTYYRFANTTKSAPIIDEDTYYRYIALQDEYGVSLEVYVDELGRFRGSPAHIGSIDATHVVGCAQGSVAISCIFENMCDDATNQHHIHARIDEITDNGDGTATVIYKGNYSRFDYEQVVAGPGGYCKPFIVGDRVYIYTAKGQLVCDAEALSATEVVRENGKVKQVVNESRYAQVSSVNPAAQPSSCVTYYYKITVPADKVNFSALDGINLKLMGWEDEQKVLIDNMSMASNGFIFDNCLSQNIRSRGLLIKASEGKILNCTFRNIGMACAAILYEIYWGESGVSENLEVARNLMDHTGYFVRYTTGNDDRYSPIAIEGLGSRVDEDYLLYKNILITDNIIRNRTTEFAVYVNSARDVVITGNDFGNHVDGESEENFTRAVHINGGMNVKIEGNTYSVMDLPIEEKIIAEHNKNIYGGDVEWEGEKVIPDKE